jgi:hypothetical protein
MALNFRSLQDKLRERLLTHIAAGELTGLHLARETGFQQAHISNFLNRKRGLSLEAMDSILNAAQISLSELIVEQHRRSRKLAPPCRECLDYVTIPIVDEQNCTATEVPKSTPENSLKVASRTVQRLRPLMETPRQHWGRFLALHVKAADAEAMAPRLNKRSVVVIDRHYNSLEPWHGEQNMYVVRMPDGIVIRYVESWEAVLVLRPHAAEHPLERVHAQPGRHLLAEVIGRICFVHQNV